MRRVLSEYLDGELPPGRRELVRRHLESCPECRRHAARLERTVQALRSLGTEAPPGDLPARIRRRIEAAPAPASARRLFLAHPAFRIGAAACLVAALGLFAFLESGRQVPVTRGASAPPGPSTADSPPASLAAGKDRVAAEAPPPVTAAPDVEEAKRQALSGPAPKEDRSIRRGNGASVAEEQKAMETETATVTAARVLPPPELPSAAAEPAPFPALKEGDAVLPTQAGERRRLGANVAAEAIPSAREQSMTASLHSAAPLPSEPPKAGRDAAADDAFADSAKKSGVLPAFPRVLPEAMHITLRTRAEPDQVARIVQRYAQPAPADALAKTAPERAGQRATATDLRPDAGLPAGRPAGGSAVAAAGEPRRRKERQEALDSGVLEPIRVRTGDLPALLQALSLLGSATSDMPGFADADASAPGNAPASSAEVRTVVIRVQRP